MFAGSVPNKKYRIFYVMNVDWDWVKQRPHFLALHLSRKHEVLVIYPHAWRRNNLAINDRSNIQLYPFYRIPFGGRFLFIHNLNVFLFRVISKIIIFWHRSDLVWISSPELYEYLPSGLSSNIVYDCMDDVLAFPKNAIRKHLLAESETKLINASSIVFCSSENLREKLISRAGQSEKIFIVNNAFEPSGFLNFSEKNESRVAIKNLVFGYVGTISSWLDFDVLIKIVNLFPSIEFHLIGPIEHLQKPFPMHDRIKYLGTANHNDIPFYTSHFDALIMPFHVTELIESVDPVKIYEYIFFNKPIVSVKYRELEKFSCFVDFYNTPEEFIGLVKCYIDNGFHKKYSNEMRKNFINQNCWENRIDAIEAFLRDELNGLDLNIS
jgi:teichuronic acid biosynthesis glycosyltransferase TuaH